MISVSEAAQSSSEKVKISLFRNKFSECEGIQVQWSSVDITKVAFSIMVRDAKYIKVMKSAMVMSAKANCVQKYTLFCVMSMCRSIWVARKTV